MKNNNLGSKLKTILVVIYGLLIFRVSLMFLRMFMERMFGYTEKVISFLQKLLHKQEEKSVKKLLLEGWPKDFKSFLFLLLRQIGREDRLATLSLILLFCFSILLLHKPNMSLIWIIGTFIVFVNIFLSKLLLLSSSVRIATKKSLFLKPPSINEFLFAFPLDYLGIIISFTSFYIFISGVWRQTFFNSNGFSSPLSFNDSLVYSLSCITTFNLSDVVAITLGGKLLSFAELMLGVLFVVVFGSIIVGLFLTEKETLEQKDYDDEKQRLFGSLPDVFGPMVHKLGGLLKDAELRILETPNTTISPVPTKKIVVSFTPPNTSHLKAFQLLLPCSRLKDWIGILPTGIEEKLLISGLSIDEISRKIEEGALGTLTTIEWTDKKGTKFIIDISIQES